MKIYIYTQEDSHECETCGYNYDSGGYVVIDGEKVFEYEPSAYCWGNANYDEHDLLQLALRAVGVEVTIDGEIPYSLNKYVEES